LKILLQINSVVNYGSTGRIVEELGQKAIENGWVSYIAFGRKSQQSKSVLINIGSYLGIKFHGLYSRLFDRHGFGSLHATKKLVKQIETINPDIIHLHNLHGYYLNISILFKYLALKNIPVVWTFHDCWPMTGHCSHFDYIGCEKWKTACFKCPQKKEYPASLWLDRSKLNYQSKREMFTSINNICFVVVSNWLGKVVKQSFLKNKSIKVITNGIDIDQFKPVEESFLANKFKLNDKFIILGVASLWNKKKGLYDFFELNNILDSTYQIILVGLNKMQVKELPSNIIGIERTESISELVSIYSSADVFLNPSVEETFGLTTAEALACGIPVIVYNATASPELITSQTGFVIEPGDINGIMKSIEIVYQKGKHSYSYACRESVIKQYNKNDRYMDYINLYDLILNKKEID
jgi:putative colanic acid biosynthesis glycosyltransferase